MRVEVLDLGINNIASLSRALRVAGADTLAEISHADQAQGADLMVLPGVGAYGAAIAELRERKLDELILRHVDAGGILFGVCLGMQLLATESEESPGVKGLNLIPGSVNRLVPNSGARVPNMGWSALSATPAGDVFPTLKRPLDYYFVHSFAVVPTEPAHVLTSSIFGEHPFVSSIMHDNVIGMQFHPEKSSRAGASLLVDVIAYVNG